MEPEDSQRFGIGLAYAFGGALLFAFPLLMTMEMWWLGFYMDRLREGFSSSVSSRRGCLPTRSSARSRCVAYGRSGWSVFLRFTVVSYALALIVCAYILWTFGRVEGLAMPQMITATLVLGFPATLGAAAARLLL